ncbi:SIMPL domain-containing protein [Ramlibacter sp. MMS24-I3-19]|uniref:SIMPL domain-containing protein n=1 Tax=Ramlibacter sp. MMS24-I3-19 TaxID=3416606 RepID=UPI003D025DAB
MNLRAPLMFIVALACGAASAQVAPPPENVVQLSSTAAVEVAQDTLEIHLQATREGADPARVQADLRAVLEAALAQARREAQPGVLDVRTGTFSVLPRYSRERRITGWQGTAELVLEGTDIARVSEAAGRVPGLVVVDASFRLSRERRERAEHDVQAQAIAQFRAKASDIARSFGFNGYGLREISVNAQDAGLPRMRMVASAAPSAPGDAALPVEAGKTAVTVNVSGSVQLR